MEFPTTAYLDYPQIIMAQELVVVVVVKGVKVEAMDMAELVVVALLHCMQTTMGQMDSLKTATYQSEAQGLVVLVDQVDQVDLVAMVAMVVVNQIAVLVQEEMEEMEVQEEMEEMEEMVLQASQVKSMNLPQGQQLTFLT